MKQLGFAQLNLEVGLRFLLAEQQYGSGALTVKTKKEDMREYFMKKYARISFVIVTLVVSLSVGAAKPVKITPASADKINDQEFRNYTVECSNGKKQLLTSWDNGKKWCLGKDSQRGCVKKQIKAAKTACKQD